MFDQPCQRGHLPLNPEILTIENKPVTISGNPSKPPNDNTKTKLKNNSTKTTQEACGKASTTSQVLKGTTQLLWTLPPLYRTSLILFMLVSRLTTPPKQRALPWLLQKRPILQTGEHPQSCGSRWHSRPCAQRMCIPTSRGFYRHFQSVPLFVCGSLMIQNIHHCAHTEEKLNHMLEWLEARCSDTHLQQVFWEARQRLHLLCAACFTGPTTICILQQPFHRRCYCFHPARCSLPPGKKEHLCEDAVRGL